jgi:asparaginyl-tRNA synthetase
MKRSMIKDILYGDKTGHDVLVKGWVRTKRDAKGLCFFEINDGSCMGNIQAIAEENLGNFSELQKVTTGCSAAVTGKLVESPAKGQKYEIKVSEMSIYGWADPEKYPLQKKRHSFEFLREIAHLRPRTNTFGAVFRVRNALSFAIHSFFQERGFIYTHTPIITANDCEGAGEMFKVTTLDIANPPLKDGAVDMNADFFGKNAGLTVSGQLEGELLATALGNIYTFGPTFRAENSNTTRHLSEFWMIEPEMAFADIKET